MIAAAVLAGVAMSACGQTYNDTRAATAGLPDLEQSLGAHEWLLDTTDSTLARTGPNPITLAFIDSESASGVAGCNAYRTRVDLSGDDGVEFTEIAKTQQSCEPEIMAAEQAYFDVLTQVSPPSTSRTMSLVSGTS
jgi:heat shock protein HslJ